MLSKQRRRIPTTMGMRLHTLLSSRSRTAVVLSRQTLTSQSTGEI
jgi:hypothetical protein